MNLKKVFLLLVMVWVFLPQKRVFSAEKTVVIRSYDWKTPYYITKNYRYYFNEFKGRVYDPLAFKIKLDQVNKELVTNGYFNALLTIEVQNLSNDEVAIKFNYKPSERTNFYFNGNVLFSFQELKAKIIEEIKNDFGKVDLEQLKKLIKEMYEDAGIYGTSIDIRVNDGKDIDKVLLRNYIIYINEGKKVELNNVSFRGNNFFTRDQLLRVFENNATSLAQGHFYDKNYSEKFTDLIKKAYLASGFVYAEVSPPRVISEENKPVELEYLINEKMQAIIRTITLGEVSLSLAKEIKPILTNKEGAPINIIEIESDLKHVISYLQGKGYYFSSIENLNSPSLLKYDVVSNSVDFNLKVNLDRRICFNETIINGNYKTKAEVISREVSFERGELITPDKLELIKAKLTGLGLFSSVRATPYMIYEEQQAGDCARTNLIIQLKERDFGLIEFSPGYRTDLGAKVGFNLNYNNIGGMNRSFAFKAQGNQRFNLDSLDDRRRLEDKKLFEYSAKVSFIEPYLLYNLLNTQVEVEVTSSWQRKRFNSFDADIFRLSPQISKNFTKNVSSSIRYQVERIIQFDATDSKDNDNFTIGGITPSMTLDFRDDQINPRKGAYFNFSSEWANHYFGSMKQNDFEVNYVKMINRNKFYFPLGNFVIATSLSSGYERNYAEGFYIPSIKVFRLDGYDEIRGFEDGEINRLLDGSSVSQVSVTDKAYFVAFKLEPRYNITDNLQIDVFFDAGRVFVDTFRPLDLRTSVGLGLKFLTPVGSLDFDYGVKLKRNSYSDGKRDAAGRFHLSIGFF